LASPVFSIKCLSERIRTGELSPTKLIESILDRIKKLNPILNAFITIGEEEELYREAQTAENEISLGKYRGPLHGIPFSIKDIIYVNGTKCTAGSKILADYIPNSTATVVKGLKRAGAILVGTNNLNEFASGITGVNPFYGTTKNPWDKSRLSGGSSGGSAVAVSTGMALLSIGTDTGGSVRVPAALCGAVGLKPTYGRISMNNIFPLAPTLDHVGFITRSVWDAVAVMEHFAGQDTSAFSSISTNLPPYTSIIEEPCSKGLRVAILKEHFCDNMDPEIAGLFYRFVEFLHSVNIIVIDNLSLLYTGKYYSSWKNVRLAEAANVHLKWLNSRASDYSPEVKEMLMQGKEISAVDYIQSLKAFSEIKGEILAKMSDQRIDALVVPTTIVSAPRINDSVVNVGNNVVLEIRRALLKNTILFNSTGLPAISIPIGMTRENMPIGVQIIGPPFREEIILSIAYCYEMATNSSSNLNRLVPQLY
jgi:aspartyl-tRNA(Asn)/glutamyl-tRNA(Gln) amidotransferase subunit A